VKDLLGDRVFVNARTDLLLHGTATADDLLARARIYEAAGADGLFVIRLVDETSIRTVASGTRLPLNVFLAPGLPGLAALAALGVRRLSAGPMIARAAYAATRAAARAMLAGDLHAPALVSDLSFPEANSLVASARRS